MLHVGRLLTIVSDVILINLTTTALITLVILIAFIARNNLLLLLLSLRLLLFLFAVLFSILERLSDASWHLRA